MTPNERARVLGGMPASPAIVAHDNADALALPPDAIRTPRDVTLGIAMPDGTEIREGPKSGDVVLFGE